MQLRRKLVRCIVKIKEIVKVILAISGLICTPIVISNLIEESFWITTTKYLTTRCIIENDVQTSSVPNMDTQFKEWHDFHAEIKDLLQDIATARRYARSSKTILTLKGAFDRGKQILEQADQYQQSRDRTSSLLQSNKLKNDAHDFQRSTLARKELLVCPEVYRGQKYDYPYHQKSMTINCSDVYRVKPLAESLTIVLNFFNEIDPKFEKQILKAIENSEYRLLPLILIVKSKRDSTGEHALNIREIIPSSELPNFFVDNVLPAINTPYALFTREMERFDKFAMLDRLIRIASYLKADVVAGSHRQSDGKWMNGCYQISFRNYTIRMVEGYDLSYNSSLYCDYVTGPFVAHVDTMKHILKKRINFIKQLPNSKSSMQIFYFDFFLTLSIRKSIVMDCPDVMFHTKSAFFKGYELDRSIWKPLAEHWDIHRLYFSDAKIDILYSCPEISHTCPFRKAGLMLPVCCYNELTELFKFASKTFEKANIPTFIDSGTLIGAVKISNTLPWDIDHDVSIPIVNSSAIFDLMKKGVFEGQNYSWYRKNHDYIGIRSRHYTLEVYLDVSEYFTIDNEDGLSRTRVLLAGHWQTSPMSPAMVARNGVGPQAYEHAEHWRSLGLKHGFVSYDNSTTEGTFAMCPRPGHQGCLDQFLTDGNLQFKDHWI